MTQQTSSVDLTDGAATAMKAIATREGTTPPPQSPPSPGPISPELFAELIKRIPDGYALIPAGYELRRLPSSSGAAVTARTGAAPTARTAAGTGGGTATGKPGAASVPAPRPATGKEFMLLGTPVRLPAREALVSSAVTTIGVMLLLLVANLFVFSHVKHVRDQKVALDALRIELANGTAAVNQRDTTDAIVADGRPLGIIEIPALGVREVYLQGTTSAVLQSGPGHRRDTVMPGQIGTSVVFGRKTAFGGPFAQLEALPLGSRILVTNGLGEKLPFQVTAIRRAGDPVPAAPATGSRITLITATGSSYQPENTVRIDADLMSGTLQNGQPIQATQGAPVLPGLRASERAMGTDQLAWFSLVLGLLLLLPVVVGAAYARARWGRWQTWLAAFPPLFALGLWTTNSVVNLLPNLL